MLQYQIILFIIAFSLALGISNEAFAELTPHQASLLQGSGFAVTEQTISSSDIDMAFLTTNQIGSSIGLNVDDGFVTIDDEDFVVSEMSGTVLREGRFIRISGEAENDGKEISISLFGRKVQSTKEGSVFGFTGRITTDSDSFKIIYTTKISQFGTSIKEPVPTTTPTMDSENIVVHISKHSANPDELTYIDQDQIQRRNYYSLDRITIEPGATITWINDDVVSHSISSGTGLGSSSRASQGGVTICDQSELKTSVSSGASHDSTGCTFTLDGRINSGDILPGESWSVTIDEPGFYRLADVDYIWMNIVVYAFPDPTSTVLPRSDTNPQN